MVRVVPVVTDSFCSDSCIFFNSRRIMLPMLTKITRTDGGLLYRRYLMIHHIAKLFLCFVVVTAVPLAAHAQDNDSASICAAFANKNYSKALALTKAAFAKVKSAGEASNLIKAILACTPPDQLGAVVVAAIEATPT